MITSTSRTKLDVRAFGFNAKVSDESNAYLANYSIAWCRAERQPSITNEPSGSFIDESFFMFTVMTIINEKLEKKWTYFNVYRNFCFIRQTSRFLPARWTLNEIEPSISINFNAISVKHRSLMTHEGTTRNKQNDGKQREGCTINNSRNDDIIKIQSVEIFSASSNTTKIQFESKIKWGDDDCQVLWLYYSVIWIFDSSYVEGIEVGKMFLFKRSWSCANAANLRSFDKFFKDWRRQSHSKTNEFRICEENSETSCRLKPSKPCRNLLNFAAINFQQIAKVFHLPLNVNINTWFPMRRNFNNNCTQQQNSDKTDSIAQI